MKLDVKIHKKLKEFELDVEFSAENGCIGLMGPSGSGKSMTLRCIAGIEKPDYGRIVLGDKVLFDSEKRINLPARLRKAGYLFQSYALFPNMTVRKNTAEGSKGNMERAEEMMLRFHIEELADRYPRQLSGGQKQRVALARLMASEPEVILLDEPFAALDDELKEELHDEMTEILSTVNKPSILVSHDKNEVVKICNSKIYAIKKGRLL